MFLDKALKHYKVGLLISTLLLFAGIGILAYSYATTGEFVQKGLDFTGGSQLVVIVESLGNKPEIESALHKQANDVHVKFLDDSSTIIIESKHVLSVDETQKTIEKYTQVKDISFRQLGAALGQQFLKDAYIGIVVAFIAMSIVVFFSLRSPIASLAVILAGASDIIMTFALMNVFNVELTLATLIAILTLIGFVVDIDILLSTRVLKRRSIGKLDERIISSFKTGITMTVCAIVAMLVLLLVSSSPVLDSIALVVIFGLVADIPFAWLQNVGILKIYCKRKGIV